MVALIIGHTTASSARIWVRGSRALSTVQVTLTPEHGGDAPPAAIEHLSSERDATGVLVFEGLDAGTAYRVEARFAASIHELGDASETRDGRLRTFPGDREGARFSFLLGACNLSSARLTALREQLAGGLGTAAVAASLERDVRDWHWPRWRILRPPLKFAGPWVGKALFKGVQLATRFELPEPDVGDPFGRLRNALAERETPAFMIHGGDQIYFDIDVPPRPAVVEEYRKAYRQAWFEDTETRAFLASLPQYMMLDNHDVSDNAPAPEDGRENARRYAAPLQAYDEYVHSRHPEGRPGTTYFQFRHGRTGFFFLDTRTERSPADGRMVGEQQLADLLAWLRQDPEALKFVVTSVPFVGQVRQGFEPCDKWCGHVFRGQRDAILEAVHSAGVRRLVFLAGDMHATYHATLRIGEPGERVVVHELAGGPLNQIEFGQRRKFHDLYRGRTGGGLPFASVMHAFTSASASVTLVEVDPEGSPELSWEAIRLSPPPESGRWEPRPLTGRVSL